MPKDHMPSSDALRDAIVHHQTYTMGKDASHATIFDWRMALSYSLRDRIVDPWFAATRRSYERKAKRVYYLSLEFLIGRLLEDGLVNMRLLDAAREALTELGHDPAAILADEPDAALGNGGLGRLAACFLESLSTLGVPAIGYGIRYEHGLFAQSIVNGRQAERPETWLSQPHAWEFERPEAAYHIGFGGHVTHDGDRSVWHGAPVLSEADGKLIGILLVGETETKIETIPDEVVENR